MSNGYRDSPPPVTAGEEYDVEIEYEGAKGDGVAKVEKFVIFVPGGKVGENLHIKITRVVKTCAFAEILEA